MPRARGYSSGGGIEMAVLLLVIGGWCMAMSVLLFLLGRTLERML